MPGRWTQYDEVNICTMGYIYGCLKLWHFQPEYRTGGLQRVGYDADVSSCRILGRAQ